MSDYDVMEYLDIPELVFVVFKDVVETRMIMEVVHG
jgi:hypothetical protein